MSDSENPYAPPVANPVARVDQLKAPPLTLGQILFSYEGRIPRRIFWGYSIAVNVVDFLIDAIYKNVVPQGSWAYAVGFVALQLPFYWIGMAINRKRWHDCNRSAWWNLIFLVLAVPVLGVALLGGSSNDMGIVMVKNIVIFGGGLIAMIALVWAFVECACTRGTVGPNR